MSSINDVSLDALATIFTFLDPSTLFCSVPYVCHKWYRARKHVTVMKAMDFHLDRRFPGVYLNDDNTSFLSVVCQKVWNELLFLEQWIIQETAQIRVFDQPRYINIGTLSRPIDMGNVGLLDPFFKGSFIRIVLQTQRFRFWALKMSLMTELLRSRSRDDDDELCSEIQKLYQNSSIPIPAGVAQIQTDLLFNIVIFMLQCKKGTPPATLPISDGFSDSAERLQKLSLLIQTCPSNVCKLCDPQSSNELELHFSGTRIDIPFLFHKWTNLLGRRTEQLSQLYDICHECLWKISHWVPLFFSDDTCSCSIRFNMNSSSRLLVRIARKEGGLVMKEVCKNCKGVNRSYELPTIIPEMEVRIAKLHNEILSRDDVDVTNSTLEQSMTDTDSFQTQCQMFYAMQCSSPSSSPQRRHQEKCQRFDSEEDMDIDMDDLLQAMEGEIDDDELEEDEIESWLSCSSDSEDFVIEKLPKIKVI